MILNRLIQPAAENAIPRWIRRTALADILGTNFDELTEDPLYRVLDKLHPHRAAIEVALVERERNLFNLDRTLYLYDLTSTPLRPDLDLFRRPSRGQWQSPTRLLARPPP